MDKLTKELIALHGKEGFRAEQWFDLMLDDVLAGFGLRLKKIPSEAVREVLFNLSGLYAQEVIKAAPFADLLGAVHMELVSQYQQKGSGQFFTPPELCKMIAQMNMTGLNIDKDQARLIRISDPAVGAGGMLLAVLDAVAMKHGLEALAWVSLTGIDIDRRCALMFPVQVLSSLYINQIQLGEIVSYQGNTLGDPAAWQTVCHYSRRDLPEVPAPASHPEVKKAVAVAMRQVPVNTVDQLSLF